MAPLRASDALSGATVAPLRASDALSGATVAPLRASDALIGATVAPLRASDALSGATVAPLRPSDLTNRVTNSIPTLLILFIIQLYLSLRQLLFLLTISNFTRNFSTERR